MAVAATTDRPSSPLPAAKGCLRVLAAGFACFALALTQPGTTLAQNGGDSVGSSHSSSSGAAAEADTAGFVPCRRTETGCVGKRMAAYHLLAAERVNVDGVLDDSVWQRVEFSSDFMMKEPEEGGTPTERTEIAFTYDDHAIYVGARMFSDDPSQIRAVKTRRDSDGNSERLIITFDSYKNLRTGYTVAVTAAGGRLDWYSPEDSEHRRDRTWDPVWTARARIDSLGWTAELEIPFSQLRFTGTDNQVWGVNINRYIPQKNEDLFWVAVPRDESGFQSWFGDLVGISNIQTRRPVEVTPYATSNAVLTSPSLIDSSDPFQSRAEVGAQVGLDVKAGLGPSLTLDATVNPDFGQVEQDAAEVNLTQFETFFPERRPFFLEGRQLLEGEGPGYYYSRRIGQPPRGFAPANVDFQDRPDQTTILGAAKITGRTESGMSIGGLLAFTPAMNAVTLDVDDPNNQFGSHRIEPPTGYGVFRVEQQFGASAHTVGVVGTATRRHFDQVDPLRGILRTQAYTGGVDWNLRFGGGTYALRGFAGGSYVQGSRASISSTQTSSARYFQRPDADCNAETPLPGCYVSFDPNRKSLSGYAASLRFDKTAGSLVWGGSFTGESPGFELNDVGRLGSTDNISARAYVRYRQNNPGKLFHRWGMGAYTGSGWNFGWTRQFSYLDLESDFTFKNFWGFHASFEVNPRAQADFLTRGGISMGRGAQWNVNGGFWSDFRKNWQINSFIFYRQDETGGWDLFLEGGFDFRPGGSWQLSLRPSWSTGRDTRQYVGTFDRDNPRTFGERYVFGFIDQTTVSTRFRANYSFTPDFSLEAYAEPFVSTGSYSQYGELSCWKCIDLRLYGTDGTTIEVSDPDAPQELTVTDGNQQFSFNRNDFAFLSFRTNLVARWEWRPGSTLFLVWQLNRADGASVTDPGRANPGNYFDAITAPGQSFFAVKVTYWLPI